MTAVFQLTDCKLSYEGFEMAKRLADEVQILNQDSDIEMCNNLAKFSAPRGFFEIRSAWNTEDLDTVMVDGIQISREALKSPVLAQLLRAGFRPNHLQECWSIDSWHLVSRSSESVSGDQVDQPVEEVTSGVGLEIRNDLSKVFAASSLDVQQLDIVVSRRREDGVLVCNMCVEAIDNGD